MTMLRVSREKLLAIPELLNIITSYLSRDDLRTLIRVNRALNAYWVPHLYVKLFFRSYQRTRSYPKVNIYGQHVRSLNLVATSWDNVVHLLKFTTNLQSLFLRYTILNTSHLQEIVRLTPHLRVLHATLAQSSMEPLNCRMTPLASLKRLEDLSWEAATEVRIDDVLFILKSCSQLKSLALSLVTLIEEFKDTNASARRLIKVDDNSMWANTSLRYLNWDSLTLGARGTIADADDSVIVHPCIRRLFQRVPNLRGIRCTGHLATLPWDSILANRTSIEHVELEFRSPMSNRHLPVEGTTLLNAIAKACPQLKQLSVKNFPPSSDAAFEQVMKASEQIQIVSVKNTEFGDIALTQLARLSLPMFTSPHSLVDLNVEGCFNVTSRGARMVLENCASLRSLNLLGTRAGTIDLFKGSKPWSCVKALERLRLEIQPVDFQPRPRGTVQRLPPVRLYTAEEQQMIKDRICSFKALMGLELKGDAMTFEMLEAPVSFAPEMRRVLLHVPWTSDESEARRPTQERAVERGKALFPGWTVWSDAGYVSSRLCSVIKAKVNDEYFTF
ncbi:hypothetical protein BGZ54_008872 [Gamsiella multidivaricata]|nr:hypothetical protein BGZ54_008872 [Gamsiella multidivaricata]